MLSLHGASEVIWLLQPAPSPVPSLWQPCPCLSQPLPVRQIQSVTAACSLQGSCIFWTEVLRPCEVMHVELFLCMELQVGKDVHGM